MAVGIVGERQKIVAVNVQFNCSCEILKEETNVEGGKLGRKVKETTVKQGK